MRVGPPTPSGSRADGTQLADSFILALATSPPLGTEPRRLEFRPVGWMFFGVVPAPFQDSVSQSVKLMGCTLPLEVGTMRVLEKCF